MIVHCFLLLYVMDILLIFSQKFMSKISFLLLSVCLYYEYIFISEHSGRYKLFFHEMELCIFLKNKMKQIYVNNKLFTSLRLPGA